VTLLRFCGLSNGGRGHNLIDWVAHGLGDAEFRLHLRRRRNRSTLGIFCFCGLSSALFSADLTCCCTASKSEGSMLFQKLFPLVLSSTLMFRFRGGFPRMVRHSTAGKRRTSLRFCQRQSALCYRIHLTSSTFP
jgi:hypothetical protein